jgi:hypothetical protein
MAKYLYNGVLLPEIPSDVLAEYPICWIRLNSDGSTYDLICGKYIWYAVGSTLYISTPSTYVWYTATASAESWTYKASYTDDGAFNVTNEYIWSSHDILNGHATATEIYCYGSEPVDPNAPEEPTKEVYYKISGKRLKGFADQARRLGEVTGELTPEQIEDTLRGVESAEGGGTGGGVEASLFVEKELKFNTSGYHTILTQQELVDAGIVPDLSSPLYSVWKHFRLEAYIEEEGLDAAYTYGDIALRTCTIDNYCGRYSSDIGINTRSRRKYGYTYNTTDNAVTVTSGACAAGALTILTDGNMVTYADSSCHFVGKYTISIMCWGKK